MAVPISGTTARVSGSVRDLFQIQTVGARELSRALLRAATGCGKNATGPLTEAAKKAATPIIQAYRQNINQVTGNLYRSVRVMAGKKKYPGVGIAVVGPVHKVAGKEWDVEKKGAGNHAWLVEWGTGPRRPATQNRRTYLNVHQLINGRMHKVANGGRPFDNTQFERMGRGYYFLMGSKNDPQRSTGRGAFVPDGKGGTRPYTVGPNETYPAMFSRNHSGMAPMQKAVQQAAPATLSALMAALNSQIKKLVAA